MDSCVLSASSETDTKVKQQSTKRKREDTGGSNSVQSSQFSPVQEKKCKKYVFYSLFKKFTSLANLFTLSLDRYQVFPQLILLKVI